MRELTRLHPTRTRNTASPVSILPHRWPPAFLTICLLFLFFPHAFNPFGNQLGLAEDSAARPGSTLGEPQNQYLIGPGDLLEILVWKEPDLSRTVRVRMDGKISLPLVDDIQAAGSTLLQVKERITKALSGYVDAPAVYVMLQENRSKRIYIVGKVNAPGEYPLEKHMTLLQAVATAGGFAEWADRGDIVVMRKGPQGQFRIKVDYKRAVSGKDIEQNILLHPDDVIVVP